MDVITGNAIEAWGAAEFEPLAAPYRLTLIDLGCGDGAFSYRFARRHPHLLCVGLDPHREGLTSMARKARRKPARGGQANVLYVAAAIATLPPELRRQADLITINFPWAGLLRAIATGDPELLRALRCLARPPCAVQILVNADAPPPEMPVLDEERLRDALAEAAVRSGAIVQAVTRLPDAAVASTWGGRLIRGSRRAVLRVRIDFGACPAECETLLTDAAGGGAPQPR